MSYRPVRLATASYPLTGGVDTKVHGLVLPPPKLQECINAYVNQTGSIQRRFGRSLLSQQDQNANTITGWVATGTYQSRLLGYTPLKLYDYSEADERWTDRGRATSYRIRTRQVDAATPLSAVGAAMDMAILGNYRCYAYDIYTSTTAGDPITAFTLTDSEGSVLAARQTLQTSVGADSSFVKVVAFGTRFYIVYRDTTVATTLKCKVIDTTSAATIATSLAAAAATVSAAATGDFDVVVHLTNGPFLAFDSTAANTIAIGFLSTAGAFVNSTTITTVAAPSFVGAATIGATTTYGIVYSTQTTPNDVFACIRTFSSGSWSGSTDSTALDTALSSLVVQLACAFDPGTTTLRVFYTTEVTNNLGIFQSTFTSGGVQASRVQTLVHSMMMARPFVNPESELCYWVFNEPEASTIQPTMFLMRYDGVYLGRAGVGISIVPSPDRNFSIQHVASSGNSYSFMHAYFTLIQTNELGFAGDNSTAAFRETIVDFVHAQSHVGVEDGQSLLMPDGALMQYDGVSFTEVGFSTFVDTQNKVVLTSSNSTGSLTSTAGTTYSYRIVEEWTDAQGERQQGTDGGPVTTDPFTAGDDTVLIVIDSNPWTRKKSPRPNTVFAIYRAGPNPTADADYNRVGTVANDPAVESVAFTDEMSDAAAASQELFRPADELDHVAPPSGHIVCAGMGRVFIAGLPEDPCLVWYSKRRGHGQALAFNDALTIQFPESTGPITAMCVFAESLIVFTERAIYRVNGDGANNTGTVGGFTEPVQIRSEVGCVGMRALVVAPMGVLFETGRGIVLLKSNFTTEDIGAPLLNLVPAPGTCTGSALIPDLEQIRFSYAAVTYVYDYFHAQWYVFTHGSEGPTCIWNDVHTAVVEGIVYDNISNFTDAGDDYAMTITLGWLHGSALGGDVQVRRIYLTGETLGSHYVTVAISQDGSSTPSQTIEGQDTTIGPLRLIFRVKKQVCSQIEITIRDAVLDVYLADVVHQTIGMLLNEVTFELALRTPRLGRLPSASSSGLAPK